MTPRWFQYSSNEKKSLHYNCLFYLLSDIAYSYFSANKN